MAVQKQDDQHEHTFSSYVRIRDVVLKTYLGRWTIGRSGEIGSGISMLPARYDDDDYINAHTHMHSQVHIYLYIYAYIHINTYKYIKFSNFFRNTINIYIYIYIYIYYTCLYSNDIYIKYIYIYTDTHAHIYTLSVNFPVRWIHWLHLCREIRPPANG